MTGNQPDLGELEPVFKASEIAEALRLSPYTIRSWLRCGRLESVKVGREFRVKKSTLDAFLVEIGFTTPASDPAAP